MVRTPKPTNAENRRGSPEAVQKRRLARKLNRLLTEGSVHGIGLDGRTERRRQRLLQELNDGTRSTPPALKPIEVLQHAHDLLELGEDIAAIRKAVKVPGTPPIDAAEAKALLQELQAAYGFRSEVYEFLGLDAAVVAAAGLDASTKPRRGRPRTR